MLNTYILNKNMILVYIHASPKATTVPSQKNPMDFPVILLRISSNFFTSFRIYKKFALCIILDNCFNAQFKQ
jgi:hypothetical protein